MHPPTIEETGPALVGGTSLSDAGHPQGPAPATGRPWLPALMAGIAGTVVLALLGLLWLGLQARAQGTSGEGQVPFKQAPDFTLGLFDGSTFRLADALAEGKPVVVNFWASWCGPCIDEAPALEQAWQRVKEHVTFVGVDVQDLDDDARAFIARYGLTYPQGSGGAGAISIAFGMRGVPETYFIAADGRVVRKWQGPLTPSALDHYLSELQATRGTVGG